MKRSAIIGRLDAAIPQAVAAAIDQLTVAASPRTDMRNEIDRYQISVAAKLLENAARSQSGGPMSYRDNLRLYLSAMVLELNLEGF